MMPDLRPRGDWEGYRLWWFHRMRRAEFDLAARSCRLQRAEGQLRRLQEQLRPPRSRPRNPGKPHELVTTILQGADVIDWIHAEVHTRGQEICRHQKRGRPSRNTVYVKKLSTRLHLKNTIDAEQVSRPREMDGIFPLVTNDAHLDALFCTPASVSRRLKSVSRN